VQLKEYLKVERAADLSRSEVGHLGTSVIVIVALIICTGTNFAHIEQSYILIAAAVIGAYMAMNIGANDVANNVGPAVGSFAMTLTMAIMITAVFEAAGRLSPEAKWFRRRKRGSSIPPISATPICLSGS
jgi:PiT family inorganic phosphate transporter